MIKTLIKAILIVICLLILIPLVMMLVGEGALVGKIFNISLPEKHEKTEIVERHDGSTIITDNDGNIIVTQSINGTSTTKAGTISFSDLHILSETVTDENGYKGMNIVVSFKACDLANAYLYCMVRIYDAAGEPLRCHTDNSAYRSSNGNVYTGKWCVPESDSQTLKVTLFLPYSELPQIKGKTEYLLDASLLLYSNKTDYEVLYRSEPLVFTYTVN